MNAPVLLLVLALLLIYTARCDFWHTIRYKPGVPQPGGQTHYRAIVLVLASHLLPLVRNCRLVWQQYMHVNSQIKVFFVYGNSSGLIQEHYDLMFTNVTENYNPGDIL